MSTPKELPPAESPRDRSRVALPVFAVFAVLVILFVTAQVVLNGTPARLARAGRNLDALAARKPDAATAGREFDELDLLVFTFTDYGALDVGYELRLKDSAIDRLWTRLHNATGLGSHPGLQPRVGEIRFRRGLFLSSTNEITKIKLGASETSATR